MERTAGIEPVSSAWEADILPMNYVRMFNRQMVSESLHSKSHSQLVFQVEPVQCLSFKTVP